ncbi:hypothetical protein MKX03_033899, partial [Papaver bracteatum]
NWRYIYQKMKKNVYEDLSIYALPVDLIEDAKTTVSISILNQKDSLRSVREGRL